MLWNILAFISVTTLIVYIRHQKQQLCKQQQQHLQTLEENKRLTHTLKRRNLRLDVITQNMSEAVFRLDNAGYVLMMNMKAEEIFAKNLGLNLPQPMQVFYRNHEWLHDLHESLRQLPNTKPLQEIEVNQRTYSTRLVSLGKQQALLIFFDISHERTQAMQHNQFLHNLMHDMKTPLTNILAYVGAIRDFGDDPMIRTESLQAITTASQRLNTFLDSLLTLEQIQHTVDQEAQCSVPHVWQEVKAHLQQKLTQQKLTVTETIVESAHIQMPAHDLFRIISNIIENVVFHASHGKKLEVTLQWQAPFWIFAVRDYGYGLSDSDIPRVVERFFKTSQAREQSEQGHGLGLSIVEETLKQYQGRLVLKQASPQGLRVELHLRGLPSEPDKQADAAS